jgi:hypothetical protein
MTRKSRIPPRKIFEPASFAPRGAADGANTYQSEPQSKIGIGEAIRRRFAPLGGVEFEPFPDEILREPHAVPRRRKK